MESALAVRISLLKEEETPLYLYLPNDAPNSARHGTQMSYCMWPACCQLETCGVEKPGCRRRGQKMFKTLVGDVSLGNGGRWQESGAESESMPGFQLEIFSDGDMDELKCTTMIALDQAAVHRYSNGYEVVQGLCVAAVLYTLLKHLKPAIATGAPHPGEDSRCQSLV